jgi:tricarballylate dehydrogenase
MANSVRGCTEARDMTGDPHVIRWVTTDSEVIHVDGKPIPNLYAAGEMVGQIFYFNYPGGTGLMAGAVFGKIAGNSACKQVKG